MPENKITYKYFLSEYHKFREIMCSRDISIEDKLEAFKGLVYEYVNLDPETSEDDKGVCETAMSALSYELNMRIGYQFESQLDALFESCGLEE